MSIDPVAQFRRLYARAERQGVVLPEAAALATADRRARPTVRFVLVKAADERGFVFFTNARSGKGADLRSNPRAALAIYWDALGKQVRVEGRIEEVGAAEADVYWMTRPRASQLAACASEQSAPLASRKVLIDRWRSLQRRYSGAAVPRPRQWTGYRLIPERIEFWTRQAHRLHDRELFVRRRSGWTRRLLQP